VPNLPRKKLIFLEFLVKLFSNVLAQVADFKNLKVFLRVSEEHIFHEYHKQMLQLSRQRTVRQYDEGELLQELEAQN
jgi:hypothetical protein